MTTLVIEALTRSADCVQRAGGEAVAVSPQNLTPEALSGLEWDSLVLTGGGDVDPARYGQKPHKTVYGVNQQRDALEIAALDEAARRGARVLGICRGSQLMNVWAGGTLNQHIGHGHSGTWHPVAPVRSTHLARVLASNPRPVVRSLHHQSVARLGAGLRVAATAPDGRTVEAVEAVDGRMIGVQFHPEMDSRSRYAKLLFSWLATGVPVGTDPSARPARRNGSRRRADTVATISWFCRDCGVRFDDRDDQIDHELVLHGRLPINI